ncbi:MAG TPA: aminotransferase class I/II-fold pyridoxal phosphate-dependent enzyme [Desulfobacteraceae bacterium]|nr:aminotransferase class I/II-fold pyridoxal phosphate-dependent enzyme [Desulfobacteraceae bacterium]HPJ68055.1 aminotransferase class I/II-fold pyridoxal phosphate-dependent enzyme [Desulfobacteraceae bacterium]HPQ28396.1 aminotransferase class I/II-fold pyridoxal phosphate-dependent enzyme [Desulfobacteraceae bacterium]
MRSTFLPFSKPSIGEREIEAVAEILRSGWITTGPRAAEFEETFRGYCNAKDAVALNSATAGMHLLLSALGIGPGDEVITPSMTWVSTVNLIVLSGATPVFADIDRDTLMVSEDSIEPLITDRTRLIIPVHFAGAAADMEPLRHLASKKKIHLVEDAAHAAGTEYRGEKIGRHGSAIFSFHPIKNMTCGEGGMFCSDNSGLVERIRRLKFHGLGVDAYDRDIQGRAPQAEVLEPGFKYNLTDIAAAIGLGQLARLDSFIEKRSRLVHRYLELLGGIDEIMPLAVPSYPVRHSWHLFIVRLVTERAGMDRETFMSELKRRNIGTGIHFKAVHTQKYYREALQLPEGALPATEWNSERICSLPLFPDMVMEDVDYVVAAIKEVLK